MAIEIKRQNYIVKLSDPVVYVDNKSRKRSGHMSHALAEFAPGKLIDFNSNCSAVKHEGHSTFGWIEYRISEDGGETYSDIYELPYSKEALYDGINVISVEKAVACDDGRIVAFCLRNCADAVCEPWDTPMYVISHDGGKTWTREKELSPFKGRVYDALYRDGVIYALEFCNDGAVDFVGQNDEHVYRLYVSYDNGENFEEKCIVPMPNIGRGYGSMLFDNDGRLHVYAYNIKDHKNMDHIVSDDLGKTWSVPSVCYVGLGIRNPQTALMDGVYILHGRSGNDDGFVLYTSEDGANWDEGTYIAFEKRYCYYSNNIVLKNKEDKNRLLIQYSEMYGVKQCVDIKHVWLTIEK